MQVEDYLRQLLENEPLPPDESLWNTLSPEEFNEALRKRSEEQRQICLFRLNTP